MNLFGLNGDKELYSDSLGIVAVDCRLPSFLIVEEVGCRVARMFTGHPAYSIF